MPRSTGRVALITGAARGIGREVARRLARKGARVCLTDCNRDQLIATVEMLRREGADGQVSGEEMDVSRTGQVVDTVQRLVRETEGIDILVNNAGILHDGRIEHLDDEAWQTVLDVNLGGAFRCCRAVVPGMKARGYGRIVNISSRSWLGNAGQCNYSASKAGVVGLTRSLALELAGSGILVNAVAPGLIDTPMTRSLPPRVRERLLASQPGGRMGTVQEVAAAVAFLASQEASFITGQILYVCGGKSVGLSASV
ncbi:MAG: SDR family oxidoreductase [Acidobacteriota bacterium]